MHQVEAERTAKEDALERQRQEYEAHMISLQRKLKARTCKKMSDYLALVLEAGLVPESLQEWEDEWSAQRQRVTEDIDSELRFATHASFSCISASSRCLPQKVLPFGILWLQKSARTGGAEA